MPGSTKAVPANVAMPPAVLRTSAPSATPSGPITVRNSAVADDGAQRVRGRRACVRRGGRRGSPARRRRRRASTASISTKSTAPKTPSFAHSTGSRFGTASEARADHAGRVLAADHQHAEHADRELREVVAADAEVDRVEARALVAGSRSPSGPSARRRRGSRGRPSRRRRRAATSAWSAASTASSTPSATTRTWVTRPAERPWRARRGSRHAACSRTTSPPTRSGRVGVVLDGVAGQAHERLLERCLLGRQLVQDDAVRRRRARRSLGARGRAPRARPRSSLVTVTPGPASSVAQPRRLGVRTRTARPLDACATNVVDGRVGDQPSAADDDQVLRGQRHLAHQVRGEEDRPALGRELLAAGCGSRGCPRGRGRSPARRGSACAGRRAARRRCRGAGPCRARSVPTRLRATLRRARRARSPRRRARAPMPCVWAMREQVVVGRAAGVDRARLEQRADLVQRRRRSR